MSYNGGCTILKKDRVYRINALQKVARGCLISLFVIASGVRETASGMHALTNQPDLVQLPKKLLVHCDR